MTSYAWQQSSCSLCPLAAKVVVATPCPPGGLLAIGEAPGADEVRLGEGFVGDAGKKLDSLVQAAGLTRTEYGRANICRCRPPENRKPTAREIAACLPFLADLIAECQPSVILTVGGGTATRIFCGPGTLHAKLSVRRQWTGTDCLSTAAPTLRTVLAGVKHVVPMPHTSPLAMNRYAPDGTPWATIAREQVGLAVQLLQQPE